MAVSTESYAQKFVNFVNDSPSPFHCVASSKSYLEKHGFVKLSEKDIWDLKPNGKYYFTRNQSTVVAFSVGGKWVKGNGFTVVGAHTDSPDLRVKPNHAAETEGYKQVAIEPYGGGLWTTWFDRDLGVAGRVMIRTKEGIESRLVRVDRPILRIPTLAIHLDRDSGAKLEFNKQTQLVPMLGTAIGETLNGKKEESAQKGSPLLQLLATELGVKLEDIVDFELSLFDTQKSTIGGLYNEFIFSPRIDNQMMSFCSLTAIVESSENADKLKEESNCWIALLYDNEEIGSQTAQGAASPILNEIVRRLSGTDQLFEVAIRKSFMISADMAHAVHPNYSEKHDKSHKPSIHKGVVLKRNVNQRYATNANTSIIVKELAKKHNIPLQDFVVRNDSLCGSTIGPIIAAATGIRTVDIGNPQLSMHSIRETCGTSDVDHAVNLLKNYFVEFSTLDTQIKCDE